MLFFFRSPTQNTPKLEKNGSNLLKNTIKKIDLNAKNLRICSRRFAKICFIKLPNDKLKLRSDAIPTIIRIDFVEKYNDELIFENSFEIKIDHEAKAPKIPKTHVKKETFTFFDI